MSSATPLWLLIIIIIYKTQCKHFLKCTLTGRSWSDMNSYILEGGRKRFQKLFERSMWDVDIKKQTNWNHMRTRGALEIGQWHWGKWRRVSFQSISDHSHNFEVATVIFLVTEVPKLVFFLSGFARSRVTILWKSHSVYFSFWYLNWILCEFDKRALRNVSVLLPSWLSEPNEPKGEEYHMLIG